MREKRFVFCMFFVALFSTAMMTCLHQDEQNGYDSECCISFDTVSGVYNFPSDGRTEIELVAHVTDCHGTGLAGIEVLFTTPWGFIHPCSILTDEEGNAYTVMTAPCYPGTLITQAQIIGAIAQLPLTFWGDPPRVKLEIETQNLNFGHDSETFIATLYCDQNEPLPGATLGFWCGHGCFDSGDCPHLMMADDSGEARTRWLPPVRGTQATSDAEHDTTGMSVTEIRVTFYESGYTTDIFDYLELYFHPFHHARLYFEGTQAFKENPVSVPRFAQKGIELHVFKLAESERIPVPGIPITMELDNSATTNASLTDYNLKTDARGIASTIFRSGSQTGQVTITADIDIYGPGDCCQDQEDGWQWTDTILIVIE